MNSVAGGTRPTAFIVHGRDMEAVRQLRHVLTKTGFAVLTFEQVASGLGGNPFIADVVKEGIRRCDVCIVLFTPDEIAAFYDPESGTWRPTEPRSSRWQARPNVIFEAGIACGNESPKTILTTLGADVELFSDADGMHILRLHQPGAIKQLVERAQLVLSVSQKGTYQLKKASLPTSLTPSGCARWAHYDEIQDLKEDLAHRKAPKTRTTLLKIVRRVATEVRSAGNLRDWSKATPKEFMDAVGKKYSSADTNWAYWHLIIVGFFRFSGIDHWYDDGGEDYRKSVGHAELPRRAVALIERLRA